MKKVLVTGISGYIGQHVALELLEKGFAVKGSVRDLARKEEVLSGIKTVIDPKENLEFTKLDLLEDEGWADALEDCDYLLHVASPFITSEPKDENILIKPALEGTLRALKAAKAANVKKVVLTSSIVAMLGDADKDIDVNQSSWTNVQAPKVTAYLKSKTLAEQAAWDFIENQKGQKMEMVTIHPGPVYGPSLNGNLTGESMRLFKDMLTGNVPMLPDSGMNISDVRDVAKIHVAAIENEEANGKRFLVATEETHTFLEIAKMLKSNGYKKVNDKKAPAWLMRLMANFSRDMKGMKPYIGRIYNGDISATKEIFNYKPTALKNTILDTAKAIEKLI